MASKRKRPVKRKVTKRCCCRRRESFEDSMIGTCRTGAKVVIAAGVLGAISNSMNR